MDLISGLLGLLLIFFLKIGQSRPLFVYFRSFPNAISKYKLKKAKMVYLGFEPGAMAAAPIINLWSPLTTC